MDRIFKVCQFLAVIYLLYSVASADYVQPTDDANLDELIKEIFNIPNDQINGGEPPVHVTESPHPVPVPVPVPIPTSPPQPPPQPEYHPITPTPVETHSLYDTEKPNTNSNIEHEPNVSDNQMFVHIKIKIMVATIAKPT